MFGWLLSLVLDKLTIGALRACLISFFLPYSIDWGAWWMEQENFWRDSLCDCSWKVRRVYHSLYVLLNQSWEVCFWVIELSSHFSEAVVTVIGGEGSRQLWKNDEVEHDGNIFSPYCFTLFTMVSGRVELMTMLLLCLVSYQVKLLWNKYIYQLH